MKRIIICADGTWNKPDRVIDGKRKPSNIVKITRSILPVDNEGIHQIVFYDEGVGTHWGFDKVLGGAFGQGLSKNIVDCYRFLVNNFSQGDEIYLFGFSRGAYTVRSLAGLIGKCGILPKKDAFFIPEAYAVYRDRKNEEETHKFRIAHHSQKTAIKFIGVWDTVGALGVPLKMFNKLNRKKYEFHDVQLGQNIENACHAISIDEQRKPFKAALWSDPLHPNQHVEQRWFAGVHSNIGGGYPNDGLANITLHWMKDHAVSHGLAVDEDFLAFYRPYYKDEMYETLTWFYKRLGRYSRPILQESPHTESIDNSVFKRIEAKNLKYNKPYRPKNLPSG